MKRVTFLLIGLLTTVYFTTGSALAQEVPTTIQFIQNGRPLTQVGVSLSGNLQDICTYQVADGNEEQRVQSVSVDVFGPTDSQGRVNVSSFFAARPGLIVPDPIETTYSVYSRQQRDHFLNDALFFGSTQVRRSQNNVVNVVLPWEIGPEFTRGDANGDGSVNISDAIAILKYLFSGTPQLSCLDAADSNDDGQLNITDGVKILRVLFNTGDCSGPILNYGVDWTPDQLDCKEFQRAQRLPPMAERLFDHRP